MEVRNRPNESAEALLHHDHYTPEELATLLEVDVNLIRHAAFVGELRAFVVDHHICSIHREAVLLWLEAGRAQPAKPKMR
jgi:hypothetical protein